MKRACSLLLALLLAVSIISPAYADFDYKKELSKHSGYIKPLFSKSWIYRQEYVEKLSDGSRLIIGLETDGDEEDGHKDIPALTMLYAKIVDKKGKPVDTVKGIALIINGDTFAYNSMLEGKDSSMIVLGEEGQLLINAYANCDPDPSNIGAFVGTEQGAFPILMDSSKLKDTFIDFCKVHTEFDFWASSTDTQKSIAESMEKLFPLEVNGIAAKELIK